MYFLSNLQTYIYVQHPYAVDRLMLNSSPQRGSERLHYVVRSWPKATFSYLPPYSSGLCRDGGGGEELKHHVARDVSAHPDPVGLFSHPSLSLSQQEGEQVLSGPFMPNRRTLQVKSWQGGGGEDDEKMTLIAALRGV